MTGRARLVAVLVIGLAVVAGLWFSQAPSRLAPASRGASVVAGSLDDLLMDLQIVPLDGQAAPAFSLETLDGRRVALADGAGRPALLYFWATW